MIPVIPPLKPTSINGGQRYSGRKCHPLWIAAAVSQALWQYPRPDISTQLRYRKQEELNKIFKTLHLQPQTTDKAVKLVTTCPACQQA